MAGFHVSLLKHAAILIIPFTPLYDSRFEVYHNLIEEPNQHQHFENWMIAHLQKAYQLGKDRMIHFKRLRLKTRCKGNGKVSELQGY